MNIGSICRHRVVTVDETSPLAEAARLMRDHHVGSLVVTARAGEGLRVSGIVTDRDLVIDVLAGGLDPTAVEVGELASAKLVSISEDEGVDAAVALMRDSGVRRLLVVDEDRQLTGIIALDDLVEASVDLVAGLGQVIRHGIEREAAHAAPLPVPPLLRVPAMGTAGWGL